MQFTLLATIVFAIIGMISAAPVATGSLEIFDKRDVKTGRGTYYEQMGGLGSCGWAFPDSSMIVALGTKHRDVGQLNCGRRIWVRALTGPGAGSRVECTVADTCPSCAEDSIDLSIGAMSALTNNDHVRVGVIQVEWDFL